ncbi:MAG: hypothetical protein D3916_01885 [Candidatus Electrothrix sp. MAN1_4]|nr:hypothetical protein [Candidatus Electrothrix sp. MAN1_4]
MNEYSHTISKTSHVKPKTVYQKGKKNRIKKTGSTKRGRAGQKRRDEEHFLCYTKRAIPSQKQPNKIMSCKIKEIRREGFHCRQPAPAYFVQFFLQFRIKKTICLKKNTLYHCDN